MMVEHWWNNTDRWKVCSIGGMILTWGKPQISRELKELILDLRGEKQATKRLIQFFCIFGLNYVKKTQSVPRSKRTPSQL